MRDLLHRRAAAIPCPPFPFPSVMSASQQREAVSECISSGAEDFLIKPVTKKEVQNIWTHVTRRLERAAGEASGPGGGGGDDGKADGVINLRIDPAFISNCG